jgi:hypothetical protein
MQTASVKAVPLQMLTENGLNPSGTAVDCTSWSIEL